MKRYLFFDSEKCTACGACVKGCPAEARSVSGKEMTAGDAFDEVAGDRLFYGSDGGLTVTGGDPLEQPCDLIALLTAVRDAFDDILVYTGYEFDELPDMLEEDQFRALFGSGTPCPASCPTAAPLVDVLIDEPYMEALNDGVCGLRGSTNQRLIVLNPALEKLYHEEERKPRSVQNAVFDGRALSIGIHGRPRGEETP